MGKAKGIRFISIAWAEGEDLQHYMGRRSRLDETEIVRIAEQLCEASSAKQALGNVAAHPTRDPEAYDLHLKGRELLKETRDADCGTRALALFEQACAKDPAFALSGTGVADASLQIYRMKHENSARPRRWTRHGAPQAM